MKQEQFVNRSSLGVCWRGVTIPGGHMFLVTGKKGFMIHKGKRLEEWELVTSKEKVVTPLKPRVNSRGEVEVDDEGMVVYETRTTTVEKKRWVRKKDKGPILYKDKTR